MSELQARIAAAMENRRAELINQPLARIWPELALVAIQEFRTPNAPTRSALDEADMFCVRLEQARKEG